MATVFMRGSVPPLPPAGIGAITYPVALRENRQVDAVSPSPLIGRAREREAIDDALERLRAGTGGIVAIEGEPGIGKSRLLAHVAESAAADGCTVLAARASAYEADLPLRALDRGTRR